MPIFEYKCNKCGRKQEELIITTEDKSKKVSCLYCGAKMNKILSPTSGRWRFMDTYK
jgi:putative FmdB family regulatory protein